MPCSTGSQIEGPVLKKRLREKNYEPIVVPKEKKIKFNKHENFKDLNGTIISVSQNKP